MKKRKVILLFSDLEGTILKESDGNFDPETMYGFLLQLHKLQQLTGADVHMHLVSPVFQKQMQEVMNKIDKEIGQYNRLHKWECPLSSIEGGAAYPEDMFASEFTGDRITPLKKPINSQDFDTARYGKANYVRYWCEHYANEDPRSELVMAIYCGNGRNDLEAMDYVKNLKAGFVVCPANSRHEAKAKTTLVSEKTDLRGITDGITEINKKIERRKNPNIDDKNKTLSEIDG